MHHTMAELTPFGHNPAALGVECVLGGGSAGSVVYAFSRADAVYVVLKLDIQPVAIRTGQLPATLPRKPPAIMPLGGVAGIVVGNRIPIHRREQIRPSGVTIRKRCNRRAYAGGRPVPMLTLADVTESVVAVAEIRHPTSVVEAVVALNIPNHRVLTLVLVFFRFQQMRDVLLTPADVPICRKNT